MGGVTDKGSFQMWVSILNFVHFEKKYLITKAYDTFSVGILYFAGYYKHKSPSGSDSFNYRSVIFDGFLIANGFA